MKILAYIPARGGSKGIPHKNIVDLDGKPLIAWTIEAVRISRHQIDILVSTDDEQIAQVAEKYGVGTSYRRPLALATDESTTIDGVRHAISWLSAQGKDYDAILILQPTSPLRTTADIDGAVDVFLSYPHQPLVSVCEPQHPPYLLFSEQVDGRWRRLQPIPESGRRQDVNTLYAQINGAIYIQSVARFELCGSFFEEGNTQFYFMSPDRSVDIDTPLDLALARVLLADKY